jgi:2-dehydropantoate 2-reductase
MLKYSVLIVGAGAVGAFYGGKLAQAGAQVSVVCRSNFEAVKKSGFHIQSPLGDFHFQPKAVYESAREAVGPFDAVIVTVKSLATIDPKDLLANTLGENTTLVLLQNGIFNDTAYPAKNRFGALAFVCLSRSAPGEILHEGYGRLVLEASSKTAVLQDLWSRSGVDCKSVDNIQSARWRKLVWNAPFNPLSVICGGLNTREILQNAECRRLVRAVMEEVCLLAQADNCPQNPDVIEKNISDTEKMTPYKTSMLLDFEHRRPMEIEAILGNAVRFGREKKLAIPHLETLYAMLSALDKS